MIEPAIAPMRAAPSARGQYAVFRVVPTRWSDNDACDHMNNVVHYQLFDMAVNGGLIENGLLDIYEGEVIGLFRGAEATAAAEGFFVHVTVDRATWRPVPLPLALRSALEEIVR